MAVKKNFRKRPRTKTGALILILAALIGGGYAYKHRKDKKGGTDQFASISRGDLEIRFTELGDIAAKQTVNIASKVSGRVIQLRVQEGDSVKAGDELAVIQPGKTGAERFLPSSLTAPISGILLRYVKNEDAKGNESHFVEMGEYVTGIFESQNPTYLMTIADMSKVIVKLKINEMDILKLEENMPVTVTVDALPDTDFPATVSMISPQAQREARGGKVFRVEVTLDTLDRRLRSGMTARVDALLEKRNAALKMPLTGLFREKGVSLVYLHRPTEKPRQTIVRTGLRTEIDVEILEGLKEKDKVLTEKPVEFEALSPEEIKKASADHGEIDATQKPPRSRKKKQHGSVRILRMF